MMSIAPRQHHDSFKQKLSMISLLTVAFTASLAASVSPQSADLGALRWLAGCWEMRQGERITEEQWMAPRGSVMIGMSRTVRGDSLIELEQVRIEVRGAALVYVASPLRQAIAEFTGSLSSDGSVVFENPAHDFPSKISYRRQGADSLIASIAGQRGGKARTIEYPYRRVACAASP